MATNKNHGSGTRPKIILSSTLHTTDAINNRKQDKGKHKSVTNDIPRVQRSDKVTPCVGESDIQSSSSAKVKGQRLKDKKTFGARNESVAKEKTKYKQNGLVLQWKSSGLALKNYLHNKGSESRFPDKNIGEQLNIRGNRRDGDGGSVNCQDGSHLSSQTVMCNSDQRHNGDLGREVTTGIQNVALDKSSQKSEFYNSAVYMSDDLLNPPYQNNAVVNTSNYKPWIKWDKAAESSGNCWEYNQDKANTDLFITGLTNYSQHASVGNEYGSISSDSGNTDTSSVCDNGADIIQSNSTDSVLNSSVKQNGHDKMKPAGLLSKRFKKRTPTFHSKSTEDEGLTQETTHPLNLYNSESTDSSQEPVVTTTNNHRRKRIGSHMSELSTESETLSCDIIDRLDALSIDDNEDKQLPNIRYAMPYLSDRLKVSLASRLTSDDSKNKDSIRNKCVANGQDAKPSHHSPPTSITEILSGEDLTAIVDHIDRLSDISNPDELMFDSRSSIEISNGMDDSWDEFGIHGNHSDILHSDVINQIDSDVQSVESNEPNVSPLFMDDQNSDSGEADDEFECECDHCQLLRSERLQMNQGDGHQDNRSNLELWLPDVDEEEGLYRINIEELSPLDILMRDRRNELELMFENVILQMLAVHPDLLGDHTPPPASVYIIENLPNVTVSQEHIDQGLSCPICLCPYEYLEMITTLPCRHIFHLLCVQAWLKKSGTCPVCRHVL